MGLKGHMMSLYKIKDVVKGRDNCWCKLAGNQIPAIFHQIWTCLALTPSVMGENEELCLAIDEELAAFLRCIDNYETASREVCSPCFPSLAPRHKALRACTCRSDLHTHAWMHKCLCVCLCVWV